MGPWQPGRCLFSGGASKLNRFSKSSGAARPERSEAVFYYTPFPTVVQLKSGSGDTCPRNGPRQPVPCPVFVAAALVAAGAVATAETHGSGTRPEATNCKNRAHDQSGYVFPGEMDDVQSPGRSE